MPEFAGPMLRRWELGNALRRLREDRGMTIADVTAAMKELYGSSFSTTKLSRMETAKRGVIPRDVHDLCVLYEIPAAHREHLMALAKSARDAETPISDDHTRGYLWFAELEQVATSIREYTLMFVPGLLQTASYARVVENLQFVAPEYYELRIDPENISGDADDRVKRRMDRQRLLERENPVRLHVVIDEGVLRRRLPDPGIMREQLEHLIRMSQRAHIVIQVVPFEAGLYPGTECAYWSILDFAGGDLQPPRTVYAEAAAAIQITDREAEVARMASAFDVLIRLALDPERSRELIEAVLRGAVR
jgi:hypothetical protein